MLEQWLPHEREFADRILMHEGIREHSTPPPCETCGTDDAPYRCLDCSPYAFSCKTCIVHEHSRNLLHKIEVSCVRHRISVSDSPFPQQWNGSFFTDATLFDLGLSHQLGHSINDICSLPSDPVKLMLFDTSGVHIVRITYCFCERNDDGNRHTQLLDARWFPASWNRPGTAFTFRLLNFIHKLQTRSKINLYDFYASLISVTDSAGLTPPVVRRHSLAPCIQPLNLILQYRYNELSLVLKIWVYLRQVRRGGGAHSIGGMATMAPGSLAVECPACPHPGRNLMTRHVDRCMSTLFFLSR